MAKFINIYKRNLNEYLLLLHANDNNNYYITGKLNSSALSEDKVVRKDFEEIDFLNLVDDIIESTHKGYQYTIHKDS